ncbi:MAG: YcxB family protein [Lachnospiraceae bacterium]|nr:YcxB family protein [Lachnospiraceae bacterium]
MENQQDFVEEKRTYENENDKTNSNQEEYDETNSDETTKNQDELSEEYTYETPEGDPLYEIDVQIKASDLFDYSLRHSYTSLGGLLSTIVGILMIYAYFEKNASPLYLIFGIIVVFYIPINLFLMSRQQAMQETFQKPLHYAFYENGMEVSQDDIKEMIGWDYIVKAVATSKSIIVYTGKNRASIFPRRDLQPDATALIRVLSTHVDPKKMKIKQ